MLWFGAALLLSPVPGALLVDHCPLRFRFPEAAALQEAWNKTDPRSSILFLGSSRMESFMQSSAFTADAQQATGDHSLIAFNASVPAADPVTSDFITSRLLADGRVPQLAIVEISPDFLARKNPFFSVTIKRQFTAGDLPRYLRDIFYSGPKDVSSLASSVLTPFYRHRTILLDWFLSHFTSAPVTAPGIVTVPAEIAPPSATSSTPSPAEIAKNTAWEEALKNAAQIYAHSLRDYKLEGATSAALEHTVAMLHAHGCKVVLVELPLTAPFRAMQPPQIEAQFPPYLRHLQEKYGCSYVNLWDRVPDTHFMDGHHGDMEGSREFSEILAREVVAPVWVKQ
ncbi:MAG: DUF1574 family protein [Chthoniobacteraceae bacterium]